MEKLFALSANNASSPMPGAVRSVYALVVAVMAKFSISSPSPGSPRKRPSIHVRP